MKTINNATNIRRNPVVYIVDAEYCIFSISWEGMGENEIAVFARHGTFYFFFYDFQSIQVVEKPHTHTRTIILIIVKNATSLLYRAIRIFSKKIFCYFSVAIIMCFFTRDTRYTSYYWVT